MNASKLTQQQTIISALQRGDWEVLAHLTDHELHDLEFAASLWNARMARDVILAELDNRDQTVQQMVDLVQKAQTSTGKSKGCTWDELINFSRGMANCIDEKAPTRPTTTFSTATAMHPLPEPYRSVLGALHERQEAERHEQHEQYLLTLGRRPGLNSAREAVALIDAAIADPVKLDAASWVAAKPRAAVPTYADRLKAERARLLKAHGYHLRRDEDGYGQHWISPRGVPLKVRRRLAKLARMIDIAKGRRPECLDAYAFELQCRAPGISSRTLDRWLTAINPV